MNGADKQLFHSIKRLIHVLTAGKRTPVSYAGVPLHKAEAHILEIVGRHPGVTASDMAGMFQVTKGAVSQLVSKLSEKELLERRPRADNMRIKELYLTPLGREACDEHEKREGLLVRELQGVLESIPEEDVRKFASVMDKVADFAER